MFGIEVMAWIDRHGPRERLDHLCKWNRPHGAPSRKLRDARCGVQALNHRSHDAMTPRESHGAGRDQPGPARFVLPGRKTLRLQQPILQSPDTNAVRIESQAAVLEQDLVAHQVRDAGYFLLPKALHVRGVAPFPCLQVLVSPNAESVAGVQVPPGLDAVVRALRLVPNPKK